MNAATRGPGRTRDRRAGRTARTAALVAGVVATACTAADNLSSAEILDELDRIVQLEPSPSGPQLRYAERAEVSTWYVRSPLTQPLRWPLVLLFGRTGEHALENPGRHVRELLLELPDEVGGDLLVGALAVARLGWIAELEQNAQSRLVAIDGLAAVATDLELALFGGDYQRFHAPVDRERLDAARAGVLAGSPKVRGDAPWDPARSRPYADALARLTAAPLPDGVERLRLLEEVTGLYAAERDAAIRPDVAVAVRAAIGHVVEGALLRIVESREPEEVDLRLCAMEQMRRLGGAAVVPLLLAVMTASPDQIARGERRYDPDDLVQLRLIHYCGQLRPPLADTSVRLPGRRGWIVDAPADFLAFTILNERDHYSKLRTPALVALTWSLQRPRLDADIAWVTQWRDQRR